jgi:hypothetical protein
MGEGSKMARTRLAKKRAIAISAAAIGLAGGLLAGNTGTANATTYVTIVSGQDPTYCLDGTISAITIQPCNSFDTHQLWSITHVTTGGSGIYGYQIQNDFNHYCVDGTDTEIYPNSVCDGGTDLHEAWQEFSNVELGGTEFINFYNNYEIDGTLADVYPNMCLINDEHCNWLINDGVTSSAEHEQVQSPLG